MRPRPPPVALLAGAFATGLALPLLGAPLPAALPLLPLLALPLLAWRRPVRPLALLVCVGLAGVVWGAADVREATGGCRFRIPAGPVRMEGRLESEPPPADPDAGLRPIRIPFRLEAGAEGCRGTIRVVLRDGLRTGAGGGGAGAGRAEAAPALPEAGQRVRIRGRWSRDPRPDPLRPERAGELAIAAWEVVEEPGFPAAPVLRIRGGVQRRLRRLLPDRWPLAEALVLARREGLDPGVRDAFAASGTAHLLAISGFHVGVIAGLLLLLARGAGVDRGRALGVSVIGAWLYVGAIGLPDAAVRACTMLSAFAAGRLLGRKVHPLGALGSAFLLLLLHDPSALSRVGFQLSFSGVMGLVVLAPPLRRWLDRRAPRSWPRGSLDAVAAGVAATLATAPLVTWHFGRIAPASVPATLLAAPLVSLAIPSLLGLLILDLLPGPVASFVAGGVEVLLEALVRTVEGIASVPGASVPLSRPALLTAVGGVGVGAWILERLRRERREALRARVGRREREVSPRGDGIPALRSRPRVSGRLLPVLVGTLAVVVGAPVIPPLVLPPRVEIVVLDVGQGDAILLGSPRGRWILVDAGPRSATWDAGERRIVPYLRRRGIRRLEAIVLTHADLDHIGGAPAVLGAVEVGAVVDPARVTGKAAWVDLLEAAGHRGVGWGRASDATRLAWDGVVLDVLHPRSPVGAPASGGTANDDSVVLLLRWGDFRALLTGDAPAGVEEAVLGDLEAPVHLLKVGHHGSATSTSAALLARIRPEVAVIPVGRGNRYGHPDPGVLGRLRRSEARVLRTDRDGTVVVRVRADGRWRVRLPDRPRTGLRRSP